MAKKMFFLNIRNFDEIILKSTFKEISSSHEKWNDDLTSWPIVLIFVPNCSDEQALTKFEPKGVNITLIAP